MLSFQPEFSTLRRAPSRFPNKATRLEWTILADWTRAAYALASRGLDRRDTRRARAHWLNLPLVLIETAPSGACRDFLWLIEARENARTPWGKPALSKRAGSKWEDAAGRARARLDRLSRLADRSGLARNAGAPLDRAAIMRDAHKRFADGQRLGLDWSFSRCLKTAWAAARIKAGA